MIRSGMLDQGAAIQDKTGTALGADLVEAEGSGELPGHQSVELVGIRDDPRSDAAGLDELSDRVRF